MARRKRAVRKSRRRRNTGGGGFYTMNGRHRMRKNPYSVDGYGSFRTLAAAKRAAARLNTQPLSAGHVATRVRIEKDGRPYLYAYAQAGKLWRQERV